MDVAIPDCTLLLDALDTMTRPLLDKCPALLFRINSIRMTLQLDTVPSLTAVEQYAKSLTAELEVIAVSREEGSTTKKAKVAAIATSPGAPPKGPGKGGAPPGPGDGGSKKGVSRSKVPCNGWITDSGCRFGKNCQFSHEAERPQKCWVCGGAHQKAECSAPGGGKGPAVDSKAKTRAQALSTPKEKPKSESKAPQKPPSGKSEAAKANADTAAAIKEATQLLQSMRIAKLECAKAITQLKDLGEGRRKKGLIDGGATACLRTAKSGERDLPTMKVELACGSCTLHINPAGTLLSPHPVTPIVSVSALLELGFRISWTKENCLIQHHTRGQLPVDASSGCPEIDFDVALQLISEYEDYVKDRDVHEARVRCVLMDMSDSSDEELAQSVWRGGVEAAAALRLLASRLFPQVPATVLEQVPPGLGPPIAAGGWNRRMRRRAERSEGVIVHFCDGESKKLFQEVADRCGWMLLHVDTGVVMSEATYSFLMSLAQKGQIKGVIGSPPFRSFSGFRYAVREEDNPDTDLEAPVRLRGKSLGCEEGVILSGPEAAARRCDDRLVLRMLLLFATAAKVGSRTSVLPPAFIFEQPEDQPDKEMPSVWATPEWTDFAREFGVEVISFDQGPLMHSRRRPTTLASNMVFPSCLVECRGQGMDEIPGVKTGTGGNKGGASWAPGLAAAVADMIWHKYRVDSKAPHIEQVKTLDASFIEHVKQGHVPYRNDCKFCIRGSARRKQHRRVLCPEAWSLSVDSAGPYKSGSNETSNAQRYLIVGVLTVPVLELQDRGEDIAEDEVPPEELGGALDDEEFFADGEDDPDEPVPQKEAVEAKANKASWDDLVKRDQEEWMREAERDYLPRVKLVEWPFVEVVPSKLSRMCCRPFER